jgi:D-alanyl-D-alanine endopeptidase (penicillin-binding protein 7)
MTPAANLLSATGWTLVHFVWQGALIGCAAAIALTALRNAKPQARYLVACVALLACLLWPAIGLLLRIAASASSGASQLYMSGAGASSPLGPTNGMFDFLQAHLALLVAAWASCAGALTLRMALGLTWIGYAAQRFNTDQAWQGRLSNLAERMGVGRPVRLRIVDKLASPITAGWWRPVVLVPASLVSGMAPDLLEALLAHELGHVKRFDYLVNLGQNLVEILLFYHPAVWWISGRIRAEREQIADELAAAALGEPRRLARALSELERVQFSAGGLAQAANGGDLMARVRRLVRPDRQALSWKAAVPVLGLAAACVVMYANAATEPKHAAPHAHTRALADFSSCAKPLWPKADLRAEHQGTVSLGFLIAADGTPEDSQVLTSSGYQGLDQAARVGIAKCHFRPATRDGQPVKEWMRMQYIWTLE